MGRQMLQDSNVRLIDMVLSLSGAVDLINPNVVDHHRRVAYIAVSIAEALGLPAADRNDIFIAAALHDIGALSLKERLDTIEFEIQYPHRHAETGFHLVSTFSPFSSLASLIRYHHVPWNDGGGNEFRGNPVPLAAHILHLSDRIDVLINHRSEVLGQVKNVRERLRQDAGRLFMPQLVEAFEEASSRESFWLDIMHPCSDAELEKKAGLEQVSLDMEGLFDFARMFSRIIDFRSRFTSIHSSGVAAVAEALAPMMGMSANDARRMRIAGYLHDLGKLAVPTEILEKQDPLTDQDFNIIKSHTFHGFRVLERIAPLHEINEWASFHHERVDGVGYPFRIGGDRLSLGSRIMAVADVFTAVTEDRPYRTGMSPDMTLGLLMDMGCQGALDPGVVSAAAKNFTDLSLLREEAQRVASQEYGDMERRIREVSP